MSNNGDKPKHVTYVYIYIYIYLQSCTLLVFYSAIRLFTVIMAYKTLVVISLLSNTE
jgi:hypothetical protein